MSDIFKNLNEYTVRTHEIHDIVGYTKALLDDIETDLPYPQWLSLIAILKKHIDDEEIAFELFDEFSSKFDSYDPDACFKKFFEAGVESGTIGIGSLVHWVKEDQGEEYQPQKYEKYFREGTTTPLQLVKQKRERKKSELPDHKPLCEKEKMPLGSPIDPMKFGQVMQDAYYATSRLPYNHQYVNMYTGEGVPEQYISVNPLDKKTGERNQDSVIDYKYAVLEFDDIPLDEQACILMMAQFPVEAIVFTGNKSLHMWLRVDADNNSEYKERVRLVAKICQDFGFKPDTKVLYDASSWVRCPGIERYNFNEKKGALGFTGKMQDLLWVGESNGWQYWYRSVYPSLLDEQTLCAEQPKGVEEKGYPTKKPKNFGRTLERFERVMPDDFIDQFCDTLETTEDKEVCLIGMIDILRTMYSRSTKSSGLDATDIFFILKEPVEHVPMELEEEKLAVLYRACVEVVNNQEQEEAARLLKRLEQYEEYVKELEDDELKDPHLIEAVVNRFAAVEHDQEKLLEYVDNLDKMFEAAGIRPLVMANPEIYKMVQPLGRAVLDQVPDLYVYGDRIVNTAGKKVQDLDINQFPTIIGPSIAMVKKTQDGFLVKDLDDITVKRIINSHQFKGFLNPVSLITDIPVFFAGKDGNRIITGYDREATTLVRGENNGYGIIDLEEAKHTIIDLFKDFIFVLPSDLSRAICGLFLPGLTAAGLLEGERPMLYTTADCPGAGKGTLTKFMSLAYTRNWSTITTNACKGGLDEALFTKLAEGDSLIVIDNLKKEGQLKEFSSQNLESMLTTNEVTGRAAFMKASNFDVSKLVVHANTNGIDISKDLSDRSIHIAIRKSNKPLRKYEGGLENWIIASSPRILSAVYTVLNEYVLRGKPKRVCKESQRFEEASAILNYIVVDILGLEDMSISATQRKEQSSKKNTDISRAICFAVDQQGKLKDRLTAMDIYDCLSASGTEDVLGVYFSHDDFQDDNGTELVADAKKKVSTVIGRSLSKGMKDNISHIEEFTIEKKRDSRGWKYVFTK
jgi:hypothetical protein